MKWNVVREVNNIPHHLVTVRFSAKVASTRFVRSPEHDELEIKSPKREDMNERKFVLLVRSAVVAAKTHHVSRIVFHWDDLRFPFCENREELHARTIAIAALMAGYEFTRYKETPKENWKGLEEVYIIAPSPLVKTIRQGLKVGECIADEVNACRDLANTPGCDMTPSIFAENTRRAIQGTGVSLKVLSREQMRRLGMGGVLGVAQGSKEEPKFLIVEHGGQSQKNPIVLVGKGVTFDTGGIDIKPFPHATDMNMDMSGGAAVVHAVICAAKMKLPTRVIGLVPAVENMPSGESYRPGDILRSLSGKTIEVLNTDAEGRIILADALTYARRFTPGLVVDVATLTGSSIAALGQRASALFCRDEKLTDILLRMGEESGDYLWPMPLWEEYEADIMGNVGDVANMATKGNARYGDAVNAAAFLFQFAKVFPKWAHIDMAPRMTAVHDEYLAKGAAGAPVRFLVHLLEHATKVLE